MYNDDITLMITLMTTVPTDRCTKVTRLFAQHVHQLLEVRVIAEFGRRQQGAGRVHVHAHVAVSYTHLTLPTTRMV